ncbi:MAG TPA: hypothetical protein VK395_20850 [Gemmataceae bacterium]|nr:hypothetical protein [Gemmataceae bacterium]
MRKLILATIVLAATASVWISDGSACGRRKHRHCNSCNYGCAPVCCVSIAQEPYAPSAPSGTSLILTTPKATYRQIPTNDRGNFEHDLAEPDSLEGAPKPSDGIHFAGSARKVAKTSIAQAGTEPLSDLDTLLDPLLTKQDFSDGVMRKKIKPNSPRVNEEKRNVSVRAFLYATKKEGDNDYHLLIGPDPSQSDNAHYMTSEVSGLPDPANQATTTLTAARNQFENFVERSGGHLPGTTYMRFDPPIPIVVTGSLFFDIDHHPGQVGTGTIVPKSVWEIHPVTTIVFEP